MLASELLAELQSLLLEHGDLPILQTDSECYLDTVSVKIISSATAAPAILLVAAVGGVSTQSPTGVFMLMGTTGSKSVRSW